MRHFLIISVILSVLFSAACGCIFVEDKNFLAKQSDDLSKKSQLTEGARVQKWWQTHMVDKLRSEGASQTAYGLFSEGGWSNAGQVYVITSNDDATLYYGVPSAKPRQPTYKKIAKDDLSKLIELTYKAKSLSDVNEPMLDGIVYEYVAAEKDSKGEISITKRIYMRKTGTKPWPDHDALIAVFQKLAKK